MVIEYKIIMLQELQNDYADLMKKVEKGLIDLHKEYAENGQAQKDME